MTTNSLTHYPHHLSDEDEWPRGQVAPCRFDGKVFTVDYDAKEAACVCSVRNCLVDKFNHIIDPPTDLLGRRGRNAYNEAYRPSAEISQTARQPD